MHYCLINLENAVESEFRLQDIGSAVLLKNISFTQRLSEIFESTAGSRACDINRFQLRFLGLTIKIIER